MNRVLTAAAIAAGLVLVLVITIWVFRLPVVESLRLLVEGAAGDKFGRARTLVKSVPLILTGLGIVVAWKGGMYNIGGEGQFVIGALSGAAIAKLLWSLPGPVLNPLILLACTAGGAVYASLAGWLQVARGVQAVISTILLNFVAIQVLSWAVSGPLRQSGTTVPLSEPLPHNAMLNRFDPQTDLHAGIFFALVAVVLVYVFLFRTKAGFRLRLVGENPRVALVNRIAPGKYQMIAMAVSGALCGLAGGVEYTGIAGSVGAGTSQNWGFLAIPVALLGGLHPAGVLFSSVYFGALFAGSDNLARFTPSGTTIVYVIQAVAVLAYIGLQALARRRRIRRTEAAL